MSRFIVETDTAANAKILINMLKHIDFVRNIDIDEPRLDKKQLQRGKALKKLSDEDWIRPGRPATDEEHEEMLEACEKSLSLSAEEARSLTLKEIREWKRKR